MVPHMSTIDFWALRSIISHSVQWLWNWGKRSILRSLRFPTYGFLYVHNWFLSSKVDNKRDISHFVPWPWKWGQRLKSRSREDSPHMVSYKSTIDSWALKSIISEILAILSRDLENEVKGQIQGHEKICHIWFPICPQLIPDLYRQ